MHKITKYTPKGKKNFYKEEKKEKVYHIWFRQLLERIMQNPDTNQKMIYAQKKVETHITQCVGKAGSPCELRI